MLAVMHTDQHADAHAHSGGVYAPQKEAVSGAPGKLGEVGAAEAAGASADATSVAARIAAVGEDGLFASRYWFMCCAPEAHLGLGIASIIFALVTLGFMMVRLQIDEITGQHSRQFHLLRIGTGCVLVLAPIFTSGGLHGEQVTHARTHTHTHIHSMYVCTYVCLYVYTYIGLGLFELVGAGGGVLSHVRITDVGGGELWSFLHLIFCSLARDKSRNCWLRAVALLVCVCVCVCVCLCVCVFVCSIYIYIYIYIYTLCI